MAMRLCFFFFFLNKQVVPVLYLGQESAAVAFQAALPPVEANPPCPCLFQTCQRAGGLFSTALQRLHQRIIAAVIR